MTSPDAAGLSGTHGSAGRLVGSVLVLLVVATAVIYGGDFFGIRDRLQPVPAPAAPLAHGATSAGGQPVLASTPYWRPLATLQGGAGTTSHSVTISGGALQWRAVWKCAAGGSLLVSGSASKPLIDSACPGNGTAFASRAGAVTLQVTAAGTWQVALDEQLDVPLDEPALASMTAPGAAVVSAGTFYGIDAQGSGTVTVYRLADGTYELRLEHFYVTPNAALDVRFSTSVAPHSDGDVASAPVAHVADLVATAGWMNFAVPSGVDPARYGSVAIWCQQLQTAYSAATMAPPR